MNSHFITLDLPKLHTLSFDGMCVLSGNYQSKYESLINGYKSYDNTLIMRSKLNWNELKWIDFVIIID